MNHQQGLARLIAAFALLSGLTPVAAQVTTCKTGNCAVGKDGSGNPILPAECQNIASPRMVKVDMDSATLRFIPSVLRLEGESSTPGVPWEYQCIQWHKVGSTTVPWHSATDDTGGTACNTATACTATNTTPPCDWESGNIDNAVTTGLEFSVCHYMKIAPTARTFRCRLHVAFGMTGSLTVVDPIQLTIDKGPAGEAMLGWSTGGLSPWDVFRDTTGPMPAPTNVAPSTTLRSFTDATVLSPGGSFFYLVTEHN
jgi:hypothetical protein